MAQQQLAPTGSDDEDNVLPFPTEVPTARWIAESAPAFSLALELRQLRDRPFEPVVIQGERGTGKSLVAAEIHFGGQPSRKPWIEIDAARLPMDTVETDLFGRSRRPGETSDGELRQGWVDRVAGGTLHIRNAETLPRTVQRTLAGILQTGSFRRPGAAEPTRVQFRLILSSLHDLAEEARGGRFSIALNAMAPTRLRVPPLSSRRADFPQLLDTMIDELNLELARECDGVAPQALARMVEYDWPGNVRELRGVLERILLLKEPGTINVDDLPKEIVGAAVIEDGFDVPLGRLTLEQMEIYTLRAALDATADNQVQAARLLGLSRDTLRYRMKKFGMLGNREA